jgi:23S rRNA (guanosine2251-2'-O)-methyltransferase
MVGKAGPRNRELAELARQKGIRVDRVGTFDLDRMAADHRGVILLVEEGGGGTGEMSLESFIAGLGDVSDVLVVILDEVTDPHNYGAILRSCDQFGVAAVVTRQRRVARHSEVIAKTSAGASAWVRTIETPNLSRALQDLKDGGFWIYGADMGGEKVWERDLRGRVALVLGGEAGLSRLVQEGCDALISIPTGGRLDSLNVSVAAGILLYEAQRQTHEVGFNGR